MNALKNDKHEMAKRSYAIVGRWSFMPGEKGVVVYKYTPDSGALDFVADYDHDVTAGQQFFDPKREVLYIVDETEGKPGAAGGGGYIRAYKVNRETGQLTFMNESCVLMTKPSYFWLDKSGEYAMVAAHTGRNCVTKVIRNADGSLSSSLVYEDVGVALMRINEDGSLGEVCDVALYNGLTPLKNQVHAHIHSVMADPTGEIYYACDKGLDMIYSYKIDHERGRIIRLAETPIEFASAPRYLCFHPTLPVLYENNETCNIVYAFAYCKNSGKLEILSKVAMNDGEGGGASDIVITPDGAFVYVGQRGAEKIVAFKTDAQTGALKRIGAYDTAKGLRGMTVTPDGKYLISANNSAGELHCYAIGLDGSLTETGNMANAPLAGNIGIIEM